MYEALHLSRLLGFEAPIDPFEAVAIVNSRKEEYTFLLLLGIFGVLLYDNDATGLPESTCVIRPECPLFDNQQHAAREFDIHIFASTPPRVLFHMPTWAG